MILLVSTQMSICQWVAQWVALGIGWIGHSSGPSGPSILQINTCLVILDLKHQDVHPDLQIGLLYAFGID